MVFLHSVHQFIYRQVQIYNVQALPADSVRYLV